MYNSHRYLRGLKLPELKEDICLWFSLSFLIFSSSNISTNEALTIPVGTA